MSQATVNLKASTAGTFRGMEITCTDVDGDPVALAGWSAMAEVRSVPADEVLIDLAPVIAADDAIGLITIPAISWSAMAALPAGKYPWDLILQRPDGTRDDFEIGGLFHVRRATTRKS